MSEMGYLQMFRTNQPMSARPLEADNSDFRVHALAEMQDVLEPYGFLALRTVNGDEAALFPPEISPECTAPSIPYEERNADKWRAKIPHLS